MRNMSIAKMLTMGFVFVLVLGALSQSAQAQFLGTAAWTRTTTITVNKAWQVSGTTLPPGTYVMRLIDLGQGGGAARTVVQVFSADERKLLATVLGLPAYRTRTSDESEFTFYESQRGAPEKLHTWFYPSFSGGIEFPDPARSESGN